MLNSSIHFVEIDFLRSRPRMPLEDLPACDYYALVSRFEERPQAGFWPIELRHPLPTLPIPLLASDAVARLDLQHLLHRVYDAAGYEDYIYRNEPEPALQPADLLWARQILNQR